MKKTFQNLTRSKNFIIGTALFIAAMVVFCNGFSVAAKSSNHKTLIIVNVADTAMIDTDLNIVITSSGQPTDSYTIDISKLTIGTDEETIAFFSKYSDSIASFTADMPHKVVRVHFLPAVEGVHHLTDVMERNNYLKDKLANYKANLQSKP
jgi:hypothetical protein